MKQEEIKIRVTPSLKKDFQDICENEETTMSNKINNYIVKEVKTKKKNDLTGKVLTKKLIRFDMINSNKRLYKKTDFTKIRIDNDGLEYTELDRINTKIFYGQFGFANDDVNIHKYNATHSIENFKIEEDWLVGDVSILNPSISFIIDRIVFRPRGYGNLDDNGVVIDFDLIGFDAVIKSEDMFKENEN